MDRRKFIKLSSLTTSGLLLSPRLTFALDSNKKNMDYEVIIIGGGPAGMSASLVLGRSRIKTLLINTEKPRNIVTTHSHGFLTQDGKHPSEILGTAKEQLKKYKSVDYVLEKAEDLKKLDAGFEVKTAQQSFTAKRVVIATGHKDNIASIGIDGLDEVYGKSVYPCPFCDGFELADKKLAVLGDAFMGPMFAKTIWHWSKDLIVFTNGEKVEDKAVKDGLKLNGVELIEEPIAKLHSTNGQLDSIELKNGKSIEREGGFLPDTKSEEYTHFASSLKIPKEEGFMGMETYKVNDAKETDIAGLYIIGDARTGWSGVAGSVAEGSEMAGAITHQIIEERWKH